MMHRLREALVQPRHELDRWQKTARFLYDLGRCGLRQLDRDRAAQMAAALSFRTLFGLLPVLVVATVLVKAMGAEEWFLDPLGELFAVLGLGDPILPTWGKIINDAYRGGALHHGYYYWILEPSVLLILTGFAFALLGFSLDRIFNPRLRGL